MTATLIQSLYCYLAQAIVHQVVETFQAAEFMTLTIIILIDLSFEKFNRCHEFMFFPASNYLLKVSSRNKVCETCSKLTTKTPEKGHRGRSGVFIVNFEHISHLFLVFLLTLSW